MVKDIERGHLPIISSTPFEARIFSDASEAVAYITTVYEDATSYLRDRFLAVMKGEEPEGRYRGVYPEVCVEITSHAKVDSRLSFGHFSEPGTYSTTITRPDLFKAYLTEQLKLIMENHGVSVEVRQSNTPIPVHFAVGDTTVVEGSDEDGERPLRDLFDVPELADIDDSIVNSMWLHQPGAHGPLAPFGAPRIDYSLARLNHYTATRPEYFQNHILFTNYQFYIDEFIAYAKKAIADPNSGYTMMVEPGNVEHTTEGAVGTPASKLPQMPTYHLIREGGGGITMVNIGVGPSNAKTITDHIAVLRPHTWLMLGHCAGLRNSQSLGDYVLAHAYVREDHVLDDDLPTRDQSGPVQRLSQSRAIALDMESATIAANGFRFRVPYGTLGRHTLCLATIYRRKHVFSSIF